MEQTLASARVSYFNQTSRFQIYCPFTPIQRGKLRFPGRGRGSCGDGPRSRGLAVCTVTRHMTSLQENIPPFLSPPHSQNSPNPFHLGFGGVNCGLEKRKSRWVQNEAAAPGKERRLKSRRPRASHIWGWRKMSFHSIYSWAICLFTTLTASP